MRLSNVLRFRLNDIRFKPPKPTFVPNHEPITETDIKKLESFLEAKPNVLVLTGAGISTESGIPDYRSEGVGMYARTNSRPVQYMDFLKSKKVRQRYWARNFVAWPRFSSFEPNAIHYSLARFEREGRMIGLVTQNVDRLHQKSGSKNVVELHGSGYVVVCLTDNCDYKIDRHDFQDILNTLNANMVDKSDMVRPDGDVEIPQDYIDNFNVPVCPKCNGDLLKPDIVFFGDNVPRNRINDIASMICNSDGLLVLGSSLSVFSGYRIVLHSYDLGLPIAIVNIGPTRGDPKADLKISGKCGDIIPKLFNFK